MKPLIASALLSLWAGVAGAACFAPINGDAAKAEAARAVISERTSKRLGALSPNPTLDTAAQDHACWLAERGAFSHQGQGGSQPWDRMEAAGYRPRVSAENIAWGQTTGAEVVADWMTSPGHRENILRRNVVEYGLGLAMDPDSGAPIWVMVYAAPM